ncbi:MAG: YdbH domain-containing protein, partial [Pseudomonadota bacterium]
TRTSDGAVGGPVEVSLEALKDRFGTAAQVAFEGTISSPLDGEDSIEGKVSLEQASLAEAVRQERLTAVAAPSPLDKHAAAFRSALSRALTAFDASVDLRITATRFGEWKAQSGASPVTSFGSGLNLSIAPNPGEPWLLAEPGSLSLAGNVSLSGGGAPRLSARGLSVQTGDRLTLAAERITLHDWMVDGTAFGADLSPVRYGADGTATGTVRVSGPVSGVALEPTALFGSVNMRRTDGGFSVRVAGDGCFTLTTAGAVFGALTLGAIEERLCPRDPNLVTPDAGAPTGRFALERLSLPIASRTFDGRLDLTNLDVAWRAGGGFALDLRASDLAAPLSFSGRLLESRAGPTTFRLITGRGPADLDVVLSDATFRGSLLPANIDAGRFELSAQALTQGMSGRGTATGVRVFDTREDPLYSTLATDIEIAILAGTLTADAPLRLEVGGAPIGDATVTLDLATLSGTAKAASGPLDFAPGGLQPRDITDRLRGIFTDASGTLETEARFKIDGGSVSGTGRAEVSNFGFQTLAVGRVEGVSGVVVFDDLLALTTPPRQAVTISSIDPGLPLRNGRLSFQLAGPSEARLEEAVWPLAGGRLRVSPVIWRIGEQERRLQASVDQVDLETLIELWSVDGLEAQGTVSGVFPIILERGDVLVDGARLTADSKGGVLRYSGAAADQATAAANNESVSLAFDALKNLRYEVLELGADGNLLGDVTVTLRLVGANPDVAYGTPFAFNVSVDSQLAQLLQSGQRATSSDWLADVVAEQIRSGADAKNE